MPNEATNSANASLDPITLEVLWTRLISTVDEAAAALVRTSFSTVVRSRTRSRTACEGWLRQIVTAPQS